MKNSYVSYDSLDKSFVSRHTMVRMLEKKSFDYCILEESHGYLNDWMSGVICFYVKYRNVGVLLGNLMLCFV